MLAYNTLCPVPLSKLNERRLRNKNKTLLNDISRVTLINESTLEINIEEDIDFELDDAIRMNKIIEEVGKGQKLFHLTIFGNRTVPSKEARKYAISELGSQYKLAEAIVVQSLSQKMVFNFMINVERPTVRTKLFTNVQVAEDWLKSMQA